MKEKAHITSSSYVIPYHQRSSWISKKKKKKKKKKKERKRKKKRKEFYKASNNKWPVVSFTEFVH